MDMQRLERAYRYCERITTRHYENFPVASWLLPRPMRPHVAAVYAFARAADDFADEEKYRGRSLELLDGWRAGLNVIASEAKQSRLEDGIASTPLGPRNDGLASHPIFIALAQTIREYQLPVQWLDDLLTAFTMDVTQRRYADWEELMTYCRYSANPIGRLVLALFGIQDPQRQHLSDCICTALQLANHWQDLRIDLARDILYIPKTLMDEYKLSEADLTVIASPGGVKQSPGLASEIASSSAKDRWRTPRNDGLLDPRFRSLMAELVRRARRLFEEGESLPEMVSGGLRWELRLTVRGGKAILDRIEAADYDVFRKRPTLSASDKLWLLVQAGQPVHCARGGAGEMPPQRAQSTRTYPPGFVQGKGRGLSEPARGRSPATGPRVSPILREALRYCRWLTGGAGSHFSLSFALLPPDRRIGMEVVYAYCRAIDDVVDQGELTEAEARAQLALWRRELLACDRGFPTHPIGLALQFIRKRFDIPLAYLEKLIAGVEMDLRPRRYETFEELRNYCEHVASVVGLISVRVFGCRHPASDRYAQALGLALQLTNILRDLKPDAQRGRVYLPAEDLRRFRVTETELSSLAVRMTGELSEAFRQLMAFECERARAYFHQASDACRESGEGRELLPARIMSAVYQRLLQRIEKSKYDVFSERIRIPQWEQLSIALPFVLSPLTSSG